MHPGVCAGKTCIPCGEDMQLSQNKKKGDKEKRRGREIRTQHTPGKRKRDYSNFCPRKQKIGINQGERLCYGLGSIANSTGGKVGETSIDHFPAFVSEVVEGDGLVCPKALAKESRARGKNTERPVVGTSKPFTATRSNLTKGKEDTAAKMKILTEYYKGKLELI